MFKKVIAIMTASVLAASILVGCGGSTGVAEAQAQALLHPQQRRRLKKQLPLRQQSPQQQKQQQLQTATLQPRKSAFASISSLITS